MVTLKTIIKEMEEIPVDRLEELYQFVNYLTLSSKQNDKISKKILSFGGAFNDMNDEDYKAYTNYTKESRAKLFNRSIEI